MNKVILIGNLTRDPEGGTTQNGVSWCRFSLAINRRHTDQNGERGRVAHDRRQLPAIPDEGPQGGSGRPH